MRRSSKLKGGGYLISALSIVLLAIPSIKSMFDDEAMIPFVILGILLSVIGMWLRWRSHRVEAKEE